MGLSIDAILETKRDGGILSEAQIQAFIDGLLSGSVTRAQAAAWLAMVYLQGMTDEETVCLTRIMTDSETDFRGLESRAHLSTSIPRVVWVTR